ncbi:MAG: ABC transporter permease [Chloroflexota bacterium]
MTLAVAGADVVDGLVAPRSLRRAILRRPAALVAAIIVAALCLAAAFAPLLVPYEAHQQLYFTEGTGVCQQYAPSRAHIFGVDPLCRDTFSRFVNGARISLAIGIFTQAIIIGIGMLIGGAAGLGPSWLDNLLMRFTDATYAFPDLLLIILMASALRGTALGDWAGGTFAIFLAIGIVGWVTIARLVRGEILSLRTREFVIAAQALGATKPRIFLQHLLPNMIGPVIVAATFGIPAAIFSEAALSYIGIGARPPTPSWGVMVNEGYGVMLVSVWPVLFPAAGIAVTMLCFTLLGDALREVLDPRGAR